MKISTELVKELRQKRMFSQQELADRAETSLFTIQRIERGTANVRPKTGRLLAKALGVEPEELLEVRGGEAAPKVPALRQPRVRAWLRERGAERHLQSDEEYAERVGRLGVEQVVEEVQALSGERSDLKTVLGKRSLLPDVIGELRKELGKELGALFLGRLIALKNRGEALIAAEVAALGDEEALRRIESFERDVTAAREAGKLTLTSGAGDE